MVEENNPRENNILNLSELTNDDLMEFHKKIDEHIKYLNNSILEVEEEE
ncbi:MAG: hypothetical protein IJN90_01025 [Bacilli bacterium]|nr:hypothetical protein [Bacilli bacterium]